MPSASRRSERQRPVHGAAPRRRLRTRAGPSRRRADAHETISVRRRAPLPAQYAAVTLRPADSSSGSCPPRSAFSRPACSREAPPPASRAGSASASARGRSPLPTPAAAPAVAAAGTFRIVALGDSLTRGAGDAAGGGGYPERVAAALRKTGLVVSVDNLAIDGSETGDFLRKVEEAAVRERIAGASLILLSIGGNDLSHSLRGAALPGEAGAESDPTAAALRAASLNLQRILSSVRAANGLRQSESSVSTTPSPKASTGRWRAQTLLKWNVALEEASIGVENALVVPTADVFDGRPDRLSPDRFHPGAEGYARDRRARPPDAARPVAARTRPRDGGPRGSGRRHRRDARQGGRRAGRRPSRRIRDRSSARRATCRRWRRSSRAVLPSASRRRARARTASRVS